MPILRALLIAGFALTLTSPATKQICSGYLPENDLQIPPSVFQNGGISQADFNEVLDKLENFYRPIITKHGGRLTVNRLWNDPKVNASADQMGDEYELNMYGGLARHQVMTKDGFMMVACHEMGHHLGGAPKVSGFWSNWASNEGEADYFSSLRCMRNLMDDGETAKWVAENQIDATLRTKCEEIYDTQAEENLCMRMGTAGFVGAKLFQILKKNPTEPRFDTPDQNVVSRTDDDHPEPQCRLDTYFQGSVCRHDRSVELSDTNPNIGTCSEAGGQHDGLRPRCWFKP